MPLSDNQFRRLLDRAYDRQRALQRLEDAAADVVAAAGDDDEAFKRLEAAVAELRALKG